MNLSGDKCFIPLYEEKQGFNKIHVSLTKLFFLRDFQIDPFVRDIRNRLKSPAFSMTLSQPQVFTNEDKTRSFCSILVQKGYNSVVQLIHQFDEVLINYKKEKYYDPPVPHCTIGSYVGDLSTEAKEKGIYGNTYVESEEYDSDDDNRIEECVDTVYLSIGNRLFTVNLHY